MRQRYGVHCGIRVLYPLLENKWFLKGFLEGYQLALSLFQKKNPVVMFPQRTRTEDRFRLRDGTLSLTQKSH